MKFLVFTCALLALVSSMNTVAPAQSFAGTWSIGPTDAAGKVELRMEYRSANGNDTWSESEDVPISELHGLSMTDLRSNGRKSFSINEDAGQFSAQGIFSAGQGGGTWTFVPNASFTAELRRRGIGTPTAEQQFQLAMGRFKLTTLDALLRTGFQRPTTSDLVSMVAHGVSAEYVAAMKGLSFDPKTVAALITLRDHGVTPQFLKRLASAGYASLNPAQAQQMVDHGVTGDYVDGLRRLGYRPSVDDLVRLVDHGVTIAFLQRMRSHGYTHLSVDELIRLRDHGF
jgi:hypothetical protein